jgi:hypothetical protein
MNMKPEAFGPAAVAMADLGGSAAGTAMMTLQQLQQGTMTLSKQQADTLRAAGLLDMSKTTCTRFGGGRLQLKPGAIRGSLEYMGDLPGWVKDVVYPHMMRLAHGDEALFQNLLGKEAPNRNAAKMIEMFGNKGFRDQIRKDLGLAGQVKEYEQAYQEFITKNPVGVQTGIQTAMGVHAIGDWHFANAGRDAGHGKNHRVFHPVWQKDVLKMRPVTFKWKGRDENDLGLIAEEVEKINPLFVTYERGQIEGVKYMQLRLFVER